MTAANLTEHTGKLFAAGLETYPALDAPTREAIERTNALALFPRLGARLRT